jgi:hypothetical protein
MKIVAEDRPKPRDLVPTDEENVKLQGSMFAYAGRYTADGQKVIHHVDISWNQSWTGTDLVRLYKLDGNTLTITTAPAPLVRIDAADMLKRRLKQAGLPAVPPAFSWP